MQAKTRLPLALADFGLLPDEHPRRLSCRDARRAAAASTAPAATGADVSSDAEPRLDAPTGTVDARGRWTDAGTERCGCGDWQPAAIAARAAAARALGRARARPLGAHDARRRLVRDDGRAALRAARDQRVAARLAAAARARRADPEPEPALPAPDRAGLPRTASSRTSLHDAHALNAWVMSSACIPAFLLARRVTGRRLVAYAVALLTVVPAVDRASRRSCSPRSPATRRSSGPCSRSSSRSRAPSRRNDVLALLGIGLAVFARTQFELLLARRAGRGLRARARERARRCARRRRASVRGTACSRSRTRRSLLGALALAALGSCLARLGTYRGDARGRLAPARRRPLARRARRDARARARDPAVRRRPRVAPRERRPAARARAARVRLPRVGDDRCRRRSR